MKYLLSNNHFRITNSLTSMSNDTEAETQKLLLFDDNWDEKKVLFDIFSSGKSNIDTLTDYLAAVKETKRNML